MFVQKKIIAQVKRVSRFEESLFQFANTHGSSRHSKATTSNLEAASKGIATFFNFSETDVVLAGNTESAKGATELFNKMMARRNQEKFKIIHTADFLDKAELIRAVKDQQVQGKVVVIDISYDARFYIKEKKWL